jgi:arylsulfatase A-like enzyme
MRRREFLLGATAAAVAAPASPRKPNIILIYADDVGYGDLSCYGATQVHTPNLDKLAGGGVRFTNVHATSATCTPSRYSLMTGEYAWRKPGTGVLAGDAKLIVNPDKTTLPSLLKKQGYSTGVVGKWHLGLGDGKVDWNQEIKPGPREIGFDYSFIIPATGDRVPCVFVENGRVANLDPKDPIQVSYTTPFPGEPTGKSNPELLRMKPSHGHNDTIVNGISRIGFMKGGKAARWVDEDISTTLTQKATTFIQQQKDTPFFLYFATHDIHVPRVPNPRFVGKTTMGPRGDAIAELDWSVGEVLTALERHGLSGNTLVMFSSDNGPVVDDGYQDQAVEKIGAHKPAGPLRGGKYSKFDGGTRVPMIARWPGQIKADTVSSALISQVDLGATLASLTGGSFDGPDSMDVLPALLGRTPVARKSLVEHSGTLAIVEGDWKYIEPSSGSPFNADTATETGNSPKPQLYNLKDDIGETNNLAAQFPDRVRSMAALLDDIRANRKGGHG